MPQSHIGSMIPSLMTLVALSSTAPAADTTRWIVTNHGRPAGDLVVVHGGDSVATRFV